jgi:hypothetical protein
MGMRNRQGGWIGLIGLLLALAIVLMLGRTVLKQMGLLNGESKPVSAAAAPSATIVDTTTPAPAAALERARGLEQQVQQQARDQQERIDAQTRTH